MIMNGKVNHTMEDIIGIPLTNLESPQEIVEMPLVNSVEPETFVEIPLVNSKKQEEIVQIPDAKSAESEAIVENSFLNSEEPKEIANIPIENSEELDKIELPSSTNLENPKEVIEIPLANSQALEEFEEQSLAGTEESATTAAADSGDPKKYIEITPFPNLEDTQKIKEMHVVNSEEMVKIPFSYTDDIIETPLAASEELEEIGEMPLSDSEGLEEASKMPFANTEVTKEIIEISLADSEESEKNIETPLVNSEDSKQSIDMDNAENEDHVIQIATTKSINDIYNDSSQEAVINGNNEHSENINSTDSDGIKPKVTTIEIFELLPDAEYTSNDVESLHCSNSNGSFAESVASSQTKSETTSQQPIDRLNENSNIYLKSENGSQHSEDEVDLDEITDVDVSEEELKATDTVSINSDTDPENDILIHVNEESSQENQLKVNTSEISVVKREQIEGSNGDSQEASSPEIHEIDSENEDCKEMKEVKPQISEDPVPLRRSSRAIKRKRYTDDLENVDDYEAVIKDPLRLKRRSMVFDDILLTMPIKNSGSNQSNTQKDKVVFIKALAERRSMNKGSDYPVYGHLDSHKIYVHRDINTMSNRSNTVANNTCQIPSILPSLTDDMFVVEAPSFIVPYVYEKPSMMPFREFVENFGKELEEERVKVKELLEEHDGTEYNDKIDKETHEKNEGSGDEEDSCKKKKNEVKKEKRRFKNDDDDASWDGESTTESEEDIISNDQINVTTNDISTIKVTSIKSENYFDCSLGNFFMGIGYNLVQEYVQNDLLKQQNRKLYRAKKLGHSTRSTETSIASLKKNLELSKENNAPYALTLKKCKFCMFKTESALIMEHHLETPHMKNNVYKCNFCSFEVRNPHDILVHMETVHSMRGKLEVSLACHQCANCPFEDNGKGKLARHLIPCMKKFKPELNLAPPFDWEPPAKIPKISKARNNMVASYQNTINVGQISNNVISPMNTTNIAPGVSSPYRVRGRSPMPVTPRPAPVHGLPIMRSNAMLRHNAPIANQNQSSNFQIKASNLSAKQRSVHQPSISITPLPRQPQPVQSQQTNPKNTFVICEICDGYIKDLEQLRNHMQSIHKVKIHPKMIYNRPPLNCQKCQFRFFTDQGLERHLLGSHGLVTSSMQEAANKGKDAGRCPVCGRVYQWKLLNHVARDHNLTLKPAHLSYKCTVCAATFGMYKQFENHVYSAHSVVAKRVIDKSKIPSSQNKSHGNNMSLIKPLKINDEITIIAQTIKSSKDK